MSCGKHAPCHKLDQPLLPAIPVNFLLVPLGSGIDQHLSQEGTRSPFLGLGPGLLLGCGPGDAWSTASSRNRDTNVVGCPFNVATWQNKPPLVKAEIWRTLVACLISTQQRSGPLSAISRFVSQRPFPFAYDLTFRVSLRWSQSLPFPGGTALQNIAISNKMVVATSEVLDQTSAIIAFDLETGVEKWRKEMNGYSLSPPTIAHGAVYVVQNSHGIALYKPYAAHLYALDVFSGQELWQKLLDTTSSGGATSYYRPIAAEDKLFIGGRIYLIGVEAFAGQELWRTSYGHRERWTPSYGNGVVYTWSNVYFSNILAANGQNTWSVDTGQSGQVSVVTEHRAVLSSDTTLIGVNLDSQAIAWSHSGTYARNMVATAGGVLYSLNGQRLEARNLSNGSLLWHYDTDVTLINAPVIAGNYVYIASEDKSFVINRTTHQLEWTTDKGGWLAVANGYLFVADRNKIIYAYRAEES
jgi:outer membrane protein assembly factor BamB